MLDIIIATIQYIFKLIFNTISTILSFIPSVLFSIIFFFAFLLIAFCFYDVESFLAVVVLSLFTSGLPLLILMIPLLAFLLITIVFRFICKLLSKASDYFNLEVEVSILNDLRDKGKICNLIYKFLSHHYDILVVTAILIVFTTVKANYYINLYGINTSAWFHTHYLSFLGTYIDVNPNILTIAFIVTFIVFLIISVIRSLMLFYYTTEGWDDDYNTNYNRGKYIIYKVN